MLMYGSNFWMLTESPRTLINRPSEAATMPLPIEDTTPPAIKTYLVGTETCSYGDEANTACLQVYHPGVFTAVGSASLDAQAHLVQVQRHGLPSPNADASRSSLLDQFDPHANTVVGGSLARGRRAAEQPHHKPADGRII